MDTNYPAETWIRIYTDGSAENAIQNGGGGIFVQYPDRGNEKISLPTGLYSSNYRAESVAIEKAANNVKEKLQSPERNIVFLTDALSVLQSLKRNKDVENNALSTALANVSSEHKTILQWIPSHCCQFGNETADRLAKEGSILPQEDRTTSFNEVKTIIKTQLRAKWHEHHPNYNPADPYYKLSRQEQVIIIRLRTNHNRLKHHLYHKFKIGETDQCPCGTASQTAKHILQFCPILSTKRKMMWPDPVPETRKLYGALEDLQRTAAFITDAGVVI